jgi:hypothetical protein
MPDCKAHPHKYKVPMNSPLSGDQIALSVSNGGPRGEPDGYFVDSAIPPEDCMLQFPYLVPQGWIVYGGIPADTFPDGQPARFKIRHRPLSDASANALSGELKTIDYEGLNMKSIMPLPASVHRTFVGQDGRLLEQCYGSYIRCL